jgi:LacI family transcriptional regulator
MSPRITLEEIAKRAGVHRTTVSLALRNSPNIPPLTRERLQTLAAQMGYRPDPMLRALADYNENRNGAPRGTTLAYLTNWDSCWGWKRSRTQLNFFQGAADRATQLGFQLEHFWLGDPEFAGAGLNHALRARGVRGVVLASHLGEARVLREVEWQNLCAVKIDYYPHFPEVHRVTNDQHSIIRLAVQRAREAGYRRIGLVMPRWWDEVVGSSWSSGFLTEQQFVAAEERVPILWFSSTPPWDQSEARRREPRIGADALGRWVEAYRPEVLISRSVFVETALGEAGIEVPRDLAFVEMCLETDADGKISGVRHNCQRVGEVAIDRVVAQLQENHFGIPEYATATLVGGTWVEGSTLPVRASESLQGQGAATAEIT